MLGITAINAVSLVCFALDPSTPTHPYTRTHSYTYIRARAYVPRTQMETRTHNGAASF